MIPLINKPNVDAADSDYPFGKIKDDTGSEDGTPLNQLVHQDFHQFFAKMFFESGLIPNNLPDNEYTGFQYYEAFHSIVQEMIEELNPNRLIKKVIEIGDWDMDASGNPAVAPVHGVDPQKVRSVSVIVRADTGTATYPLSSSGAAGELNGAVGSVNATTLTLFRLPGGLFDSTNFDSTSYNRGWITIEYEQ